MICKYDITYILYIYVWYISNISHSDQKLSNKKNNKTPQSHSELCLCYTHYFELILTINPNIDCVAEFRFHVPWLKMYLTCVASLMSSSDGRDVQRCIVWIQDHDWVILQLLFVPVPGDGEVGVPSVNITKKLHILIFEDIGLLMGLQLQDRFK